jgi:pimeloyl-ACP methyl ester carboxylesterase
MAARGGALTSSNRAGNAGSRRFSGDARRRTYDGPTLFVAGSRSDYVQPSHEPAIRRLFPNAEIARLDSAGHWLHAEQPAVFLAIIERFLSRRSDRR